MFEFVPFAIGALLAALISTSRIKKRPHLLAGVTIIVGLGATIVTGEYLSNVRISLPNDVALAPAGAIFGVIVPRVVARAL